MRIKLFGDWREVVSKNMPLWARGCIFWASELNILAQFASILIIFGTLCVVFTYLFLLIFSTLIAIKWLNHIIFINRVESHNFFLLLLLAILS